MSNIDDYDPSVSLSSYFASRTSTRLARLWAVEKAIHDLAEAGIVQMFEGAGTDPTGLTGYANTKLWLNVSAGVTASPGVVRYYDGTGDETDINNWPVLTVAGFRSHIDVYSQAEVVALIAGGLPTFTSDNFSNESSVTGATITDALNTLLTALANYLPTSQKGAANGVASLDGSGKLTAAQIPDSIASPFQFEGTWNASTNSPALADGVGNEGDLYRVSVAGTTSLDGEASWAVGDELYFGGGVWNKLAGGSNAISTPDYDVQVDGGVKLIGKSGTHGQSCGGYYYTVVVTNDERILIWGDHDVFAFNPIDDALDAYELPLPWDTSTVKIEAVYCAYDFMLVQTDEATGNLYAIGANADGQLGQGNTTALTALTNISAFSSVHVDKVFTSGGDPNAGANFWFAIMDDGDLWGCGENGNYQMGDGTTTDWTTPAQIEDSGSNPLENIVEVSFVGTTSGQLARATDGSVWRWGVNADGQLGDNTTSTITQPEQVETSPGSGIARTDIARAVVTGGNTTASRASAYLLTTAGKLLFSGDAAYGLGDNTTTSRTVFTACTGLIDNETVSDIFLGGGEYATAVAIDSTGGVWMCGYMATDALQGAGSTTNILEFLEIGANLPSGWNGAATSCLIAGGNANTTIFLEATISGAKRLASIGHDASYQTGQNRSVAAASQTWQEIHGMRGTLSAYQVHGNYTNFGLQTLNTEGESRYHGYNVTGMAGNGNTVIDIIPTQQPQRTGLPRKLKAPVHLGAYSAVTEYSFQDMVSNQGATWIYRAGVSPSTGNAPPTLPTESNTYWQLVATPGADGDPGDTGDPGAAGADGVDPGVLLTWDTANDDSNPGAGEIKASVADLSSDGTLYINDADRSSNSIRAFLATLADTDQRGTIYLTRTSDGAQAVLTVSGSVTQVTDYSKVPFTHDSGATSFSASDAVSLLFARGGNDGAGDATVAGTITDNRIVRGDGGAKGIQESGAAIDDSGNIVPSSDDGSALGTASLKWSDLFLASGALINWNNGNVTLTHSPGALSFGTSLNLTLGSIELGHASDTTIARSGAGDITIEGNAVYRAGGTDVAVADGGTGASTASAAFGNLKQAASLTATGVVELGTAAEINTGSDTGRVPSIDELRKSNYGVAVVPILVFDDSEDVATGDGAGDIFWRVPSILNGWDLIGVAGCHQTAGTGSGSETTDIQIHNVTQAADMLTTKLTIDEDETDSSSAAAAAAIDASNDDVATGDQLRIDVDAVTGTSAPKGLLVELQFRKP